MKMLWILTMKELRDGFRNRWIAAAIIVLGILALVLSVLGSAPTGSVSVSELDVSVISLASLSVYLIPLIALMLSFDAMVGELERGTMMLLLTYPVTRWQVIMGKFLGHVLILLIAILVGYGGAVIAMILVTGSGTEGWQAYVVMMASSMCWVRYLSPWATWSVCWSRKGRLRSVQPSACGWCLSCCTIYCCLAH